MIYTHDEAGRTISKEIAGDHTDMAITYDFNGMTKLLDKIVLNDAKGNSSQYEYKYDSFRRIREEKETTPYAEFTRTYTYNSFGRIATEENQAKSLLTAKSTSKKIRNTYQNGGLKSISDFSTYEVLWELDRLNARGQTLSVTIGKRMAKNYSYDRGYLRSIALNGGLSSFPSRLLILNFDFDFQQGLLNSRYNSLFDWNESFGYDNLDRLTQFNDNNGNNSHTYDPRGRITQNSQVGTYTYSGNSYQQVSMTLNPSGTAHYDALDHQDISFNAFKKPVEIEEAGKDKISFDYNAFEGRSNMFYGGTQEDPTQRRYLKNYAANGSMEIKIDNNSGKTTFVFYIGGDAYSAPVIWHSEQSGTTTKDNYFYLHRDYLGSILAITDANGVFKEKRHFDAWGNIAKLEDGNGNALSSFAILDRGYTGHEHLLSVGIIHMNGRLYDPVLHRFLSPDNFVQDPYNTQNFNRYGYVLNNPLKYTDPSGEFFIAALGAIAYGAIIGAATAAAVYSVSSLVIGSWTWSGLGTAMLYGAIGGAISGGLSFAATLASPTTSAFFQSTTLNIFSETASQAGTSALMGDEITLGTVLGSVAGGFAGSKIGNWNGIKGGWTKNVLGEIGFNAGKGAARGAVTGGVEAGFNGNNIAAGLVRGAKKGTLGGMSQAVSMISIFGATYTPSTAQMKYASKMASAFGLSTQKVAWRKGGIYQAVQPLWRGGFKREVTWGRHVVTFDDTKPEVFGHEFGHIIQVYQQGWGAFQARGIFEQLWIGLRVYGIPGSNEYNAEGYLHTSGGCSMGGYCPVH